MLSASHEGWSLDGKSAETWRLLTRRELDLPTDRPIIATGHQPILFHPGILAKYLVVDAFASAHNAAAANLIVDQHEGDFATIDVPVRSDGDSLQGRSVALAAADARRTMAAHAPVRAHAARVDRPALDGIRQRLAGAADAMNVHANAGSAAMQMAMALRDLIVPWVEPMPIVAASALLDTTLGRAILRHMVHDPDRCADSYNRAVMAAPDAGIDLLRPGSNDPELPVWRADADGRRISANHSEVRRALDEPNGSTSHSGPKLLPKALLMTAIARLGMCDLFVHGTGGAVYDAVMERWVAEWLGVRPSPMAVVTATLRLPLGHDESLPDPEAAQSDLRRALHDPESLRESRKPSDSKRRYLDAIVSAPRGSMQRSAAFQSLHAYLAEARNRHSTQIENARRRLADAKRAAADRKIADRRTWPFVIYPPQMLDELAEQARNLAAAPVTSSLRG